MSWEDQALCREKASLPEYDFFPNWVAYTGKRKFTKRMQAALELCERCPVKVECLDEGMKINGVGIWGGEVFDNSRRFRSLRKRWLEAHDHA